MVDAETVKVAVPPLPTLVGNTETLIVGVGIGVGVGVGVDHVARPGGTVTVSPSDALAIAAATFSS